eukprot:c38773_g1_i1.p1 GENE.c38773_g1_i1~~c38773_g1_i1.p1  ORF type:complete len:351 (-),score=91.83 c38773_g1_i1:62-1114(-)
MSDHEQDPPEVMPSKAYKNMDFLASREARTIRVICEFEEGLQRLRGQNVKETILVFGSAKALNRKKFEAALHEAEQKLIHAKDQEKAVLQEELEAIRSREWLCEYMDKIRELARLLTEWSMSEYRSMPVVGGGFLATGEEEIRRDSLHGLSNNTWTDTHDDTTHQDEPATKRQRSSKQSLMICTGGARGIMEAANRGASEVPHAKNIGMGISLPHVTGLNPYVSPELGFMFHYFFTRKYWMMYPCRALVAAPGGFATMDMLFEFLTLKQTGKIKIDVPVVLFGKSYWNEVFNFEALVEFGTISQADLDSLFFTDDVQEAFSYITKRVVELQDRDREIFFSALHDERKSHK